MSTRERSLDSLLARAPRVAPFAATRDRPQLLTPARDVFDGTFPEEVKEAPSAGADVDIDPVMPDIGTKKPRPHDGPLVVLEEPSPPVPFDVTRTDIVAQCADTIGMLVRHRAERPMHELAVNERQLFAQLDAFAITGGTCVRSLVAFWRENGDDPWKALGAALALACLDGIDTLRAISREIELFPEDALDLVAPLAEALVLAPHPHVPDLIRDLRASEHPIARAIGILALSRRGELSFDEVKAHLGEPHLAIVAAAVRAAHKLSPATGVPLLAPLMAHREPVVAWPAARQLLVWGRPEPYFELRNGRAEGLGPHALEVLVFAGGRPDLELFEQVLARSPASPKQLSAIARFGAPSAWALLVHHLGNDDLADAAHDALALLFGERVPARDAKKPAAWRSAIAAGRFDADVRYRRGEPWRPRAVAQEMRRGDFPRDGMAARIDELMVRTGVKVELDLAAWSPDVHARIELAALAFEKADGQYPPGTWTTRAR